MPSPPDSPSTFPRLVGRAVERVEDAALLTGRGRFADDVGERPGTAHAAVLRSPHAHAEIVSLDATAALSMPEVVTVLTGAEVAAWSRPFIAGVKQPMRHYALAVDRVRYTGEPVAVVVARDRYGAEDALERIEVEYRELDPVVDPVAAAAPGAPLLHRDVGSNVVSDRRLRYGDPDAAFASAAHRVAISVRYPRNACTPIEGFVVVAEHLGDDGYDVLSNFQGPFTLHPVMARALGVPGARLRRFGRFRGRTLFGGMLSAPLMMPEVITGLSLLLLFITLNDWIGWPSERGFSTMTITRISCSRWPMWRSSSSRD